MNKQDFITKACKDRNLIYTPPIPSTDEVQAEKLKFIDLQNCISDGAYRAKQSQHKLWRRK